MELKQHVYSLVNDVRHVADSVVPIIGLVLLLTNLSAFSASVPKYESISRDTLITRLEAARPEREWVEFIAVSGQDIIDILAAEPGPFARPIWRRGGSTGGTKRRTSLTWQTSSTWGWTRSCSSTTIP